jgi:hypothetical protein
MVLMIRVVAILIFIYTSAQPVLAFEGSERFPATERGSIAELIPNYKDLRCESKCEGKRYACGEIRDEQTCVEEGRKLGCVWACK